MSPLKQLFLWLVTNFSEVCEILSASYIKLGNMCILSNTYTLRFAGTKKSLQELSTSVITSALLQHLASFPTDSLYDRLPDYVPPSIKNRITDSFKALTEPVYLL